MAKLLYTCHDLSNMVLGLLFFLDLGRVWSVAFILLLLWSSVALMVQIYRVPRLRRCISCPDLWGREVLRGKPFLF